MRSKVAILWLLVACKGEDTKPAPSAPAKTASTEVKPVAALPASFPLPGSPTRKLVRSTEKLGMIVWEYEYGDLQAAIVAQQVADALPAAGYTGARASVDGQTHRVVASRDGKTYTVDVRARAGGITSLAVRAYAESGPTTLSAPQRGYPEAFPFLAGGTASHAPAGGKLRIAYQQDATDVESAIVLAAERAGWACEGSGEVRCTRGEQRVTFATQAAPGGSLLHVAQH